MLDILDPKKFNEFQGDLIPQRINQIRAAQAEEAEKRKKRKEEFEKRMEEQREKEREAIKRKKELEALRKKMKQEEDEQKKMAESREFVDEDGTVVVEGKVEEHEDDDDDPQSVFEKEVIEGGGDGAGNMSKNPRLSDLDFDFKVSEEDMEVGEDDAESDMDETANGEDARLIPSGQGEAAAVGKLEESPNFSGDVISVPVTEDHQPDQVLIKRQSKDETTEALPAASPKVVASNNVIETLTVMINKLLPAARKEFDYDDFNERVMKGGQYVLNERWYRDHFVMSCPAQSFLERFSLQGEFFDKY